MENTPNTNTKSIIGFLIFLGIAAGAIALAMNSKKNGVPSVTQDETPSSSASTTPTSTTTTDLMSSTTPTALTAFKNGTYSSTGVYTSPAGKEQVNVSVVLENDIITDVTFKGLAENPKSINMQEQFESGYKTQVVGKNIGTLKVTKVSGSSLTPIGFNDAIAKIKDEAEQI